MYFPHFPADVPQILTFTVNPQPEWVIRWPIAEGLITTSGVPAQIMVGRRQRRCNPMRNPVVVGVTGTPAGLAAVRLAAREAVSRACQLRVVHAFTWPSPTGDLDYEPARRAASRAVEDAVATAKRSTPRVRGSGQLVDGAADRVLVQLSRGAELLVLGDDDLATTPWLPSSSVLVQTVARAWCSVLVARGP